MIACMKGTVLLSSVLSLLNVSDSLSFSLLSCYPIKLIHLIKTSFQGLTCTYLWLKKHDIYLYSWWSKYVAITKFLSLLTVLNIYILHIGPYTTTKQRVTYCCNILTAKQLYSRIKRTEDKKNITLMHAIMWHF